MSVKNVPNIVTCLNLVSGCLSCIATLEYKSYTGAFIFIALAALFDFLDGFTARLLKAYSLIGSQLDSLADVVSFGVAPGIVVYSLLWNITSGTTLGISVSCLAFLIPVFAALRLAKFNVDTRQKNSFLGLPVPANGLFWAALAPAILPFIKNYELLFSGTILVLIIVFCALMVSELPMFSLKFKHYRWKGNQWSYILLLSAIALILLFRFLGVCLSIGLYILLSVIQKSALIKINDQ